MDPSLGISARDPGAGEYATTGDVCRRPLPPTQLDTGRCGTLSAYCSAFPDLSSEVLHLTGPLQSGDSSARYWMKAGQVVGIGSGGLQQAAASVSWVMRGGYLNEILTSTDTLPAGGDATSLFAYALQNRAPPTPGIVCAQLGLTYRGDDKMAQLAATADSNAEVEQLARDYRVSMADLAASPFHIRIEAAPHWCRGEHGFRSCPTTARACLFHQTSRIFAFALWRATANDAAGRRVSPFCPS